MGSNASYDMVGVIGAGSFGTALANLLAENRRVLLYARRKEVLDEIHKTRQLHGKDLHPHIQGTGDLAEIAHRCELIFPVVPSAYFPEMLQSLAPHLNPAHKLIHGTKGLYVLLPEGQTIETVETLTPGQVKTMSELIREETVVRRIGCVAGPNLAREILDEQPAATVVASPFEEVRREVRTVLRSTRFRVHGNADLIGIELAGVLKNIMALAAGMLRGLDYGDNTLAMLITQGLAEMIHIGKALGADVRAFLGLAGIGDLVATCTSPRSRNYTVGYRIGQGEKLSDIIASMQEVAEGVQTVRVIRTLS
ncbi:MAG: NAD(P)H-dependent glycerol-3-phosphate dehydrogenase, partial [Bacteroidota bacterium]